MKGMVPIYQDLWSPAFFEYLKFHAHFDLTNPFIPQSGQFAYRDFFCRFSCIVNHSIQTGVLRILQTQVQLRIDPQQNQSSFLLLSDYDSARFGD